MTWTVYYRPRGYSRDVKLRVAGNTELYVWDITPPPGTELVYRCRGKEMPVLPFGKQAVIPVIKDGLREFDLPFKLVEHKLIPRRTLAILPESQDQCIMREVT